MEEEKYTEYFKNYCVEDQDDVILICQAASSKIYDRVKLKLDDPKLLAVIFSQIYEAILDELKSLEDKYTEFKIDIADRLEIGYTNSEDEDDEKVGNFMIYMKHLSSSKKDDSEVDPTLKSADLANRWNTENIVNQPEILKKISITACEKLKSIDVYLASSELIIPIFVYVYEAITSVLSIRRKELDEFEYEINFISCFYIGAREAENDDASDQIYIRPNIESKLKLKNDLKASSKYE